MKMKVRGVNKPAKYCEVCQENFGNGFSFCPVCGEPLKAVEVEQIKAPTPEPANALVQAEEEVATVVSAAPIAENTAQSVGPQTVKAANKPINFQENQMSFHDEPNIVMKLIIPIKQADAATVETAPTVSKKPFKVSFVITIAVAVAMIFGAALELPERQILSSEATAPDDFKSMSQPQRETPEKEETSIQSVDEKILPQSAAVISPMRRTVRQPDLNGKAEKSDWNERLSAAALPRTVPVENIKLIRQPEISQMLPKIAFKPIPPRNPVVKEELSERPNQAMFEERIIKYRNQKSSGFKNFFNKIGSGFLYLPKRILKRQKR